MIPCTFPPRWGTGLSPRPPEQRDGDARPGRTERMPQRDRPAVVAGDPRIAPEPPDTGQRLRGEGLVELHGPDPIKGPAHRLADPVSTLVQGMRSSQLSRFMARAEHQSLAVRPLPVQRVHAAGSRVRRTWILRPVRMAEQRLEVGDDRRYSCLESKIGARALQ